MDTEKQQKFVGLFKNDKWNKMQNLLKMSMNPNPSAKITLDPQVFPEILKEFLKDPAKGITKLESFSERLNTWTKQDQSGTTGSQGNGSSTPYVIKKEIVTNYWGAINQPAEDVVEAGILLDYLIRKQGVSLGLESETTYLGSKMIGNLLFGLFPKSK